MHSTDQPARFLNMEAVATAVGLSVATIKRLRRKGAFPDPYQLSAKRVGWSVSDIDDWIASRAPSCLGRREA